MKENYDSKDRTLSNNLLTCSTCGLGACTNRAVPLTWTNRSTFRVFLFLFLCAPNACQEISTEYICVDHINGGFWVCQSNMAFIYKPNPNSTKKKKKKTSSENTFKLQKPRKNVRSLFGQLYSSTPPSHLKAKQKRENKGHSIQPNLTVKSPDSTF